MLIKHSNTSNIIRFTLKNSSTGIGLTGLTNASAGLIIATICNNETTTTVYTQAASNIETIAALGTYAAPTASKCRFKEVDATNHKGLYEFQFANARFAIASARSMAISVTGAASLLDADYEIQLVSFDPHDSVRMGLTAMPNAAADGAGGLPISDAGGLDLDTKLANAHEITTARMEALTDWINGGRLDLILDIIAADTTTDIPAKLLKYVQLLARSDAAIATDNVTELTAINADGGSGAGDFSNQTDAEEAIRDRGDFAWTTGAGGSDRLLMVDTTIATLANQTSFTLAAGSADDNAYNNCTIIIEDVSTAAQKAVGIISDYTGATKTITLKYDPAIFTMATTDKVYILAENALKSTLANRQLNVAADGDIAGNIDGSVASVVGHTVQTGDGYAILNNGTHGNAALETLVDEIETILKNATYGNSALQVLVAALQTDLDNGTDGLGALKTLIDTVNTDLSNGTDGLGALKTLIDANKTELDGLQGTDGKALVSTDAQDLSGTLDVNTKTATATALDLILKDSIFALAIADAIWDEILTGVAHNIASSAGRRVREIGAFAIHSGTAQAGSGYSITLDAGASASDGIYNRNLIVLTDNTGSGQTRTIVDYNGTTKVCVIDRDWRVSPDATTEYQVVPDDTPLTVDHGVAQGGTSTTITIRDYASSVDDAYLCNIVTIIAGKGRGQARLVGAYDGTTKVVTICGDIWVEIPDITSIYVMMPYGTTCTSCLSTSALALINTEIDNALDTAIPGSPTDDSINQRIKALPSGIAKNVALSSFTFFMVLTSDHVTAATGKTITGQISKDGGAFTGLTNSITEIGNGLYKIDIIQTEMNADTVSLKFTETDCDQRVVVIYTT